MGKRTPQPPPVPDPKVAIDAQAKANRVDSFTPFGSTVFSKNPDGSNRSDSKPSPEIQGVLDRIFGNLGQENKVPFESQKINGDFQNAFFNQAQGLIDRDFNIREDRLRSRLSNRGLPSDSEAFKNEFRDQVSDPRQRAIQQAAVTSIQAGDARQNQAFNREQSSKNSEFNRLLSILNGFQPVGAQQVDALTPFNQQNKARQNNFNQEVSQFNQQRASNSAAAASVVGAIIAA